jgi:hypothetical protein
LTIALSGGGSAVRAEGAEKDVVIFGDGIKGRFTFKFEDKILLNFLGRPSSGDYLYFGGFGLKVVLNGANKAAGVSFDMFGE